MWHTKRSNHVSVTVSNIKNIIRLFFVFWKLHSKSTWLKNAVDLNNSRFIIFGLYNNIKTENLHEYLLKNKGFLFFCLNATH